MKDDCTVNNPCKHNLLGCLVKNKRPPTLNQLSLEEIEYFISYLTEYREHRKANQKDLPSVLKVLGQDS